jgi:hypothetical protein
MSEAAQLESQDKGGTPTGRGQGATGLFPVQLGRFDDALARSLIDELANWVVERYREDLAQRPSKHVYIRLLPEDVIRRIDRIRDNAVICEAILRQFGPDHVITPMKHTDELYISHYNKDRGGDQGLFDKHYDGNLRFLSFGTVVRSLIYLRSDATYKVVFADSGVEKAFATYDFGVLDFHRELHWVEGEYSSDDEQRILLKCNYLVAPRDAGLMKSLVMGANTGVFYVVKAAMEYSKSPQNPVQRFVGLLCNVFRLLNNIHPFVPLLLIAAMLAAATWGLVRLLA